MAWKTFTLINVGPVITKSLSVPAIFLWTVYHAERDEYLNPSWHPSRKAQGIMLKPDGVNGLPASVRLSSIRLTKINEWPGS
jgi:hypothetical protein